MSGAMTAGMGMGNLMSTTTQKLGMIDAGMAVSDTLSWKQMEANANKNGNAAAVSAI